MTSPHTQDTQDTISKKFSSCSISINAANQLNRKSSIASIDLEMIQSLDKLTIITDQIKSCGI